MHGIAMQQYEHCSPELLLLLHSGLIHLHLHLHSLFVILFSMTQLIVFFINFLLPRDLLISLLICNHHQNLARDGSSPSLHASSSFYG